MKPIIISSCSAGETSVMMNEYLMRNMSDKYDIRTVFINTGHEREKTLEFMKKCDEHFNFNTVWIEACWNGKHRFKIVNYDSAYRNYQKNGDDPFEGMIAKHGIPNMNFPHCSRELKTYTMRHYLRSIGLNNGSYHMALGIRSDEPNRLNWEKAKREMILYFARLGKITKPDVNEWWMLQPFRLDIKSYEGNCILCWKKSLRKLFTLIVEGIAANDVELLAEIEWLKYIHEKYGRYFPKSRSHRDNGQTIKMFRGEMNITDLIEECEGFIDFATDERSLINYAQQLSIWGDELDSNYGCVESCEIM